jgi:uncharacterized PurR-regulated membrane protein YhhQ (DUF165 family)
MNLFSSAFMLIGYLLSTSLFFFMAFMSVEKMTVENGLYILLLVLIVNVICFVIPIHYLIKYKSKYYELKNTIETEE